jgi:hypothetical protein
MATRPIGREAVTNRWAPRIPKCGAPMNSRVRARGKPIDIVDRGDSGMPSAPVRNGILSVTLMPAAAPMLIGLLPPVRERHGPWSNTISHSVSE